MHPFRTEEKFLCFGEKVLDYKRLILSTLTQIKKYGHDDQSL